MSLRASCNSSISSADTPGEVVDEIEWVLDLVRDTGGELTERGQLLCLDEAILRGSQLLQRCGKFACAGLHAFEQANVLDRDHRLVSEGRRPTQSAYRRTAAARSASIPARQWHAFAHQRHA